MQRNEIQDAGIITIQSLMRRQNAIDKYAFNQLSAQFLENYKAFVIGNDPTISLQMDQYCDPGEKIAIVGTSVMRVVLLASQLSDFTHIPKIFLIDNSAQVTAFWKAIRDFLRDETLAGDVGLFMGNLPAFLTSTKHLYIESYAKIFTFFSGLIRAIPYDLMKKIICHATVLKQSWEHKDTFEKIDNVLKLHGIKKVFIYPSNIVPYVRDKVKADRILENIESLSPVLSIHTDLCGFHGFPEKVFFFTNQNPHHVSSSLFKPTCNMHKLGKYVKPLIITLVVLQIAYMLYLSTIIYQLLNSPAPQRFRR